MTTAVPPQTITPIIMAGGAGTRLWPASRDTMPKQFLSLFGDERSTFQTTLERVSGPEFGRPIIVTANDFRFVAAEQMTEIGLSGDIILEPERRDSAAAVAVGTHLALERGENTLCVVLAADHMIDDAAAFVTDCLAAAAAAADGRIMTIGIDPTHPTDAYGYIAVGAPFGRDGTFALERFVEKPDVETAKRYIAGGYLWNSGNFVFPASLMRDELKREAPAVWEAAGAAVTGAVRDLDFLRLDAEAFGRSPSISIDYAVMEKTARAGVLKASFGWSDVGSWDAVYAVQPKNKDGNVLSGNVSVMGTTNSLVRSDDTLATVIGLDDIVVVNTQDALLVAARSRSSEVKTLVSQLKAQGKSEATQHLRIHRPWGWYQQIDVGQRYQVKHISVRPGGVLSLQRHYHRAEHWVVIRGAAEVTIDDKVKLFHENEAAYLPIGCVHRLRNPGKIELRLIEVQVGSYTGEDDIIRIEDIYART